MSAKQSRGKQGANTDSKQAKSNNSKAASVSANDNPWFKTNDPAYFTGTTTFMFDQYGNRLHPKDLPYLGKDMYDDDDPWSYISRAKMNRDNR